ncbi:succinate dehydrogenase cytochrome b subunit [Thermoflavifilum aggregans]|nr:succinate dehydrogenase cytochrome b subunit [Thermoflavifilum aggregans]
MKWRQLFISPVGRKIVMGFTGLFLILFLIVHVTINACIFLNDHGETFNAVAHFMGTNILIHFLELGLFVGLILHIVQGWMLWSSNSKKRPVKYAVWGAKANSHWYSRSMGLLGTLIFIFLVIHLANFWVPNRYNYVVHGEELNLFERMKVVFSHPVVVLIYLGGLVSLSYHLMHGFQSAFRTFGMNSRRYIPIVKGIGVAFAIIVPMLFALMPILLYFKVIS